MERTALPHKNAPNQSLPNKNDTHYVSDEELLAAVRAESSKYTLTPAIVFLGGSYNEGLCTETSDYDLVVVHHMELSPATTTTWIKNTKVEILFYSWSDYLRIAIRSERSLIDGSLSNFLDLRRRFLFSRIIFGNDPDLKVLDQIDYESFKKDSLKHHVLLMQESFKDFRGIVIGFGDINDQYIRLRTHLERVIDSLLIVLGDYYSRTKWRCARIRRTFNRDERLHALIDLTCAALSGRILLSDHHDHKIMERLSSICILCEYLLWFYEDWPSFLQLEDIHRFLSSKEAMPYCSILKLPNQQVYIQSLHKGFVVPPEVAHSMYLEILGCPSARQKDLNTEFCDQLTKRGFPITDYAERMGLVQQAMNKLSKMNY